MFIATHLDSIFETQPWLTRSCREISHGRTPLCASSTIRWRTTSGNGRPFTNTPPNWLTPPWPARVKKIIIQSLGFLFPFINWRDFIHGKVFYLKIGHEKNVEEIWRRHSSQNNFKVTFIDDFFNRIHIFFRSKLVKIKWKTNAHTKVIWALNIFSTTWKWLLVVIQSLLTWIYFRLYDILLFLVLGRFDFNFVTEIIKVFAENWLNCVET